MAWTALKGVQVQIQLATPARPTPATLLATNVGSIRVIIESDGADSYFDTQNTYIASVRAVGITTIVCIRMITGVGQATWAGATTGRVDRLTSRITSDIYELGNEHGDAFAYPGNTISSNWSGFFDACADATARIRVTQPTATVILGSAVDAQMNNMLDAAEARVPKVSTFVNGYAIHPYGQGTVAASMVTHSITRVSEARSRVPISRSLYITEMGWGADGNVSSTLVCPGATLAARETAQKDMLQSVFDQLWLKVYVWRLAVVGWFEWHDVASPSLWWHYCGLFRNANTARPSYTAFQNEPRIVQTGNASLSGQTTFTVLPQGLALGKALFSGRGTQTGLAHKTAVGKVILSSNGTVVSNGSRQAFGSGLLTGDSDLVILSQKKLHGQSALAGAGLLTALGRRRGKGGANLVGNADQTALARKLAFGSSTTTVLARGTLTVIGTKRAGTPNTAAWSASGNLTVISVRAQAPADATFTGITNLVGKPNVRRYSNVTLSSSGSISGIFVKRGLAKSPLSATATVSVTPVKVAIAKTALSAHGTANWTRVNSIQLGHIELSAEGLMEITIRGWPLDNYEALQLSPNVIIYIGTPRTLEASKPKVRIQADNTTLAIDSRDATLPITMATS